MESAFGVDHGEFSKGFSANAERGLQAMSYKAGGTLESATKHSAKARYAAARILRSTSNGRPSNVPGRIYSGSRSPGTQLRGQQMKQSENNALGLANRKKPGRYLP